MSGLKADKLFHAAYSNSTKDCEQYFGQFNKAANTEAVIIAADNRNYQALDTMLGIAAEKGNIFGEEAGYGIDMDAIKIRLNDTCKADDRLQSSLDRYQDIIQSAYIYSFEEMACESVSIPLPNYKQGRAIALSHQ